MGGKQSIVRGFNLREISNNLIGFKKGDEKNKNMRPSQTRRGLRLSLSTRGVYHKRAS